MNRTCKKWKDHQISKRIEIHTWRNIWIRFLLVAGGVSRHSSRRWSFACSVGRLSRRIYQVAQIDGLLMMKCLGAHRSRSPISLSIVLVQLRSFVNDLLPTRIVHGCLEQVVILGVVLGSLRMLRAKYLKVGHCGNFREPIEEEKKQILEIMNEMTKINISN